MTTEVIIAEQECAVLEERVRAADRRIDGLEEEQA